MTGRVSAAVLASALLVTITTANGTSYLSTVPK